MTIAQRHCGCLVDQGSVCPNGHPGRKTFHISGQPEDIAAIHEALKRLRSEPPPPHMAEGHTTGDERCPRCKALREQADNRAKTIARVLDHCL